MMLIGAIVIFVFGAGLGYAVGWNRALHPGKVESQAADVASEGKSIFDRIKSKL